MLREFISNRHITRQSIENRRAVRLSACSSGGIPFNFITPRYPRTGASKSWNEKLRTDQINGRPQYGTARFIDPVILCPIRRYFCYRWNAKGHFLCWILPCSQAFNQHTHTKGFKPRAESPAVPNCPPYPIRSQRYIKNEPVWINKALSQDMVVLSH